MHPTRFLLAAAADPLPEKSDGRKADLTDEWSTFPLYRRVGYDQSLRPQFHFTSRMGWINDPNGLVYADGEFCDGAGPGTPAYPHPGRRRDENHFPPCQRVGIDLAGSGQTRRIRIAASTGGQTRSRLRRY